jgi:hypothetical protein
MVCHLKIQVTKGYRDQVLVRSPWLSVPRGLGVQALWTRTLRIAGASFGQVRTSDLRAQRSLSSLYRKTS